MAHPTSRLNESIKCVVMLNNLVLAFLALIFIILNVLILVGQWAGFDPNTWRNFCTINLIIGGVLLLMTVFGCIGAVNQTEREGYCSGRRLLATYLVLLIALLVVVIQITMDSTQITDSIEMTLQQPGRTEYDAFETKIAPRFNGYYFDALCETYPENSWYMGWIDDNCPASVGLSTCAMAEPSSLKDQVCDGSRGRCNRDPFSTEDCCPDEIMCDAAIADWKDNGVYDKVALSACPYHQCRRQALRYIMDEVQGAKMYAWTVVYILIAVVFLTGLLICYRPRDDLTEELIKTGVVVERSKGKKKPFKERRQTRTSDAPP